MKAAIAVLLLLTGGAAQDDLVKKIVSDADKIKKLNRKLSKESRDKIEKALGEKLLDADGLNAFEAFPELLGRGNAPRVLTPHPGEAARLLKTLPTDIQADRTAAAKELAERFLSVAVLKGHRTVVADGKQVYINKTGNPGMATGGSGDVLAGMIGALIGQQMSPFDAACLATQLHGKAGDIAAKKIGQVSLMATDMLDALPEAFRKS